MSTVIGIDLGTSNSCVSCIKDGKPIIIPDKEGRRTTPSVFAIDAIKNPIVGYEAKAQQHTNRLNTIFAVKRFIGRKFNSEEVKEATKKLPYKVVPSENGDAWVEIDGELTSPEEVSSYILVKMKEVAEEHLSERIHRAVITVPAHFNDAQRQATKEAGMIAGLEVLRIINEPTAAALAYGLDVLNEEEAEKIIAVFDLGGGTFDISILQLKDGVFDVLSTNGDTFLGGEDFDLAIVHYLTEEFEKQSGANLASDKKALQRLKDAAKQLKHDLTDKVEVIVSIPFMAKGGKHLELKVNRKTLEQIVAKSLDRLTDPCLTALEDAGLDPKDVTDVILVGGMTRMPAVKKCCEKIFKVKPREGVDPDEAVSMGAAIQAGLLEGLVKGVSLLDVTSLSLGIEVQGAKTHVIIPRNTKIPTAQKEIFTTSAPNQPQVSIHILQGESEFAPDNRSLGMFELMDVPPAPRGVPNIEVEFSIDAEGIVKVSAQDLDVGEEKLIEITADSGLSEEELDRLLSEKRLEQEQKARMLERRAAREQIVDPSEINILRDELRSLIFMTQSKLNTQGKGYRGQARTLLENSLSAARDILADGISAEDFLKVKEVLAERAALLDEYIDTLL